MRNFFSTIKPFYFVSKTFGYFPLTLEGLPEKENFVVKWSDIIAPVLNGLLSFLVIVSISLYPLENGIFTPLMTMTSTLIAIFGTVLNFVQLVYQTSKHKTIANFLTKVNHFDKKMELLGLSVDHKKQKKFVTIISVLCLVPFIWMSFPLLLSLGGNEKLRSTQAVSVACFFQLLQNFFYVSQFSCAALALKERFELLNKYLMRYVSVPCDINVISRSSKRSFDHRLFEELYGSLCERLLEINSVCTPHLIVVMGHITLTDIFSGYGAIREFLKPSGNFFNFVGGFVWNVCQLPVQFFMAYSGSSTTKKAEKSLVLISEMITSTGDHNIQQKIALNILMHQLQVREKRFSNIFFNIDYYMILVMFSTIVTYLVITCQVDLAT